MAVDKEALRKMLDNRPSGSGSGGNDFYSLPSQGSRKIRVLPPWEGASAPGKLVTKHFNISDELGVVDCLKTWDLDCPVCDVLEAFSSLIDVEDLEGVQRAYLNVLVLDDDEVDPDSPKIMGGSDFNLYWLIEKILDPEVGDITDPDEGHSITFARKRNKGPFERTISLKPTPIASTDEKKKEILDNIKNLDKIFPEPDSDKIKKVKDAAKQLKAILKSRYEDLKKSSSKSASEVAGQVEKESIKKEADTETKKEPEKVKEPEKRSEEKAKPEVDKPQGAPECFGKEYNEDSKECLLCPHEITCEEVSKG